MTANERVISKTGQEEVTSESFLLSLANDKKVKERQGKRWRDSS